MVFAGVGMGRGCVYVPSAVARRIVGRSAIFESLECVNGARIEEGKKTWLGTFGVADSGFYGLPETPFGSFRDRRNDPLDLSIAGRKPLESNRLIGFRME